MISLKVIRSIRQLTSVSGSGGQSRYRMASKYQKPYTIPEGYPALLKAFTREVLRAQPDNIYEFGARYFADLSAQQGGSKTNSGSGAGSSSGRFQQDLGDTASQ